MKGINYRSLLDNWEAVIDKLCEECTPYDVLEVVAKNVNNIIVLTEKLKVHNQHLKDAQAKIQEAMKLLDPEQ